MTNAKPEGLDLRKNVIMTLAGVRVETYNGPTTIRVADLTLFDVLTITDSRTDKKPNRLEFMMMSNDSEQFVLNVAINTDKANAILKEFQRALQYGLLNARDCDVFREKFEETYTDIVFECLNVYVPVKD